MSGAIGLAPSVGQRAQTWCTPRALILALEERYTAHGFDLDAAADASNGVTEYWLGAGSSISEDALSVPWQIPREPEPIAVWCNPPWNNVGPFVDHAIAEVEAGHCAVVVFVLPTRADTRWWAVLERGTDAVVTQRDQIDGRIAYVDPTGAARSAPAEGTTVWILRPRLRAADLRPVRPRRIHPHDNSTTDGGVNK